MQVRSLRRVELWCDRQDRQEALGEGGLSKSGELEMSDFDLTPSSEQATGSHAGNPHFVFARCIHASAFAVILAEQHGSPRDTVSCVRSARLQLPEMPCLDMPQQSQQGQTMENISS